MENVNHPDECTLHILKAREMEEAGDFKGAIDQIRLALSHKPSASRILRRLGLLYFKINKTAIGIKCLQKAICVNKQDTISRHQLAQVYIQKKEFKKAAKIYLEILDLSTRYFDSATRLGESMFLDGYRPQAIALFSKLISKARLNVGLKKRIIDVCLEAREFRFALSMMEHDLKENPSNNDLLFKTGMVYWEVGDYEKAMSNFRMVDSNKKGNPAAKLQIARIYQLNGRILQADDYVRQVLCIDPKNPEAIALSRQL